MLSVSRKRIASFLSDQTYKTIRRPSRLIAIPYNIGRHGVIHVLGSLIAVVTPHLPVRIASIFSRHILEVSNFIEGQKLLEKNQPVEAWPYFSRSLKYSANPNFFFAAAVCLLLGLGRYRDAMAVFSRANALRAERAKSLGVANSPIRFLESIWHGNFGHLAQMQYLVKLNILESRPREDTVIYVPPDAFVSNRFLLEQWRPYINIIDDPKDLPLPLEALQSLAFDFLAPRLSDGTTAYYWDIATRVLRRWSAEKRGPLLTLAPDIVERGCAALASVGIPQDAWFVTLHVREAASKLHHAGVHNVLNSEIDDYLPAIREITKRGGWVIRLGDPQMRMLPRLLNVLDYCHSPIRSDWMDIFLLARSRFFLGTSSGPAYVPVLYQVPTVLTNWWPLPQRPWDEKAIFIPKLYRNMEDGAPLPLSKALSEPFGYCNSVDHLRRDHHVTVENNSLDDIRDAVIEMIARLEGVAVYSAEDVALRERVTQIFETSGAHGFGQIGRDFLRRNKIIVQ